MASKLYRTSDEFFASTPPGDTFTVRDGLQRLWLAWEDEGGEWWAIRPRDEDDILPERLDDHWRPIGPTGLDSVPTPWLVSIPDYKPAGPRLDHLARIHEAATWYAMAAIARDPDEEAAAYRALRAVLDEGLDLDERIELCRLINRRLKEAL